MALRRTVAALRTQVVALPMSEACPPQAAHRAVLALALEANRGSAAMLQVVQCRRVDPIQQLEAQLRQVDSTQVPEVLRQLVEL